MPAAQDRDAPDSRIHLCLPGSTEGLRLHPLSEIGKPGSGTEPIHQEHVMCSWFRGSCPSDVKSAGHPEPGFPISLSGSSAALCAPGETQRNPAVRSIPALSSGHTQTRGRTAESFASETLFDMGRLAFYYERVVQKVQYIRESYNCFVKYRQKLQSLFG